MEYQRALIATAAAASLCIAGCGIGKKQNFRTSLLPPATATVAGTVATLKPPAMSPSLYLRPTPGFLMEQPKLPARPSSSDLVIQKAEEAYQTGRVAYLAGDYGVAREKFDRAVDLMLAASESPSDRHGYEKRLDEIVDAIHRYDLSGMGASASADEPGFEKAPLEEIIQMTFPIDPKLKDKVQSELSATVSQLPLSYNESVLAYINYFSGRGRGTMVAGLERAGRYRPLIQRVFDEEGLPQELIHLAQAESGFMARALSRKSAAGMWQFLGWRGREYGLEQTLYTDDRLDPEKATRAAARHLRDLYKQFGDWYLAIAAYNCGPVTVERAVERTGYADFWELRARHALPLETTNYVPIILAMTIMSKNSQEYGLDAVKPDTPLECDTVEVESPTHLALVADLTGAPVYELRALNPSLLKGVAPAGYTLRVPRGSANTLVAALQTIPSDRRVSWRMHKVTQGDTLASIGKRYGTAASSIAAANRMESGDPVIGDMLMIPAAFRAEPVAAKAPAKARRTAVTARRTGTAARRPVLRTAAQRRPAAGASSRRPVRHAPVPATRRIPGRTVAASSVPVS
jgi:membrane-bound lytic murein transglycosylase D